jgi:hypothetical protein
VTSLASAVFRASPRYALVPWNRLDRAQGNGSRNISPGDDSYGVLLPADGAALPVKEVSSADALIFLSVREPGPLPPSPKTISTLRGQAQLARLLIGQIIELETKQGFVSGMRACAALGIGAPDLGPDDVLGRISHAGLDYALALPRADAAGIARKLYLYNRAPPGPRAPRVDGARETLDFLLSGGFKQTRLDQDWSSHVPSSGWIAFSPKRQRTSAGRACKLYISPAANELPMLFGTISARLAESGATQFKVGLGTFGLLRPDKMVSYFAARDEMFACAERLARDLDGAPAHGVPFTAALSADGLLSWGIDPSLAELSGGSWRQWITGVLGDAIVSARGESLATDAKAAALTRLASEGVDPTTFAPTARWTNEYAT